MPTRRSATVFLDLGANAECDAANLVQFAVMGEVFARNVLGLENPSVGILNVGEEDLKGNDAVKKAAAILQQSKLAIRFHGFVEGDDIALGTVDVIVTDGFTGNIALKTAEGTARLYTHLLKRALVSSPLARLGALLVGPALRAMRARVDPRVYDGAMFLGLNGVCVKSHGGTDALGFSNAIRVAVQLIADGVNDGIKQDFTYVYSGSGTDPKLAAG
jgi:glycerol-3-phosphate acyltransferase PlsX